MGGKIKKLEDLIAWQEAKRLAVVVYQLTSTGVWSKDFSLCNQMRRCAVSVPSNIAEGYGRGGNKEFVHFLSIAKGSLYELKTQLIISKEIGYCSSDNFDSTIQHANTVAKIITGLVNYLKESEFKGNKFAEPEVEYNATSNFELKTSN